MKTRGIFQCITLVAFVVAGCRHAETSTPEATVRAFATAVGEGDFKTAAGLVKGGKPDADFTELTKGFKGGGSSWKS